VPASLRRFLFRRSLAICLGFECGSLPGLLTLAESGFDKLPADRRLKALRGNESGWAEQMRNIETYVAQ
jgi:hypothetical protein